MNIQRIACGNGNCYLVSENSKSILIDTSRLEYKEKLLRICENANLQLVVLTHGHVDHIQNAAYLSEAFQVPIAMHEADIPLTKNNLSQPLSAKGLMGNITLKASLKSFQQDTIENFTPSILLKEGDDLSEYGITANIIELPGHTNGSIGIMCGNKNLIVGDALMNLFYPTVSMLYHNYNETIESARKISQMGNCKILFGHGNPVANRNWVK